jgi:hypothetical protein
MKPEIFITIFPCTVCVSFVSLWSTETAVFSTVVIVWLRFNLTLERLRSPVTQLTVTHIVHLCRIILEYSRSVYLHCS